MQRLQLIDDKLLQASVLPLERRISSRTHYSHQLTEEPHRIFSVNRLGLTHAAALADTANYFGLVTSEWNSFRAKSNQTRDPSSILDQKITTQGNFSLFSRTLPQYFTHRVQSNDHSLQQSSPGLPEILTIDNQWLWFDSFSSCQNNRDLGVSRLRTFSVLNLQDNVPSDHGFTGHVRWGN